MRFDDLAREREPDTGAIVLRTVERLEDFFASREWHSRPVVGDLENRTACVLVRSHFDVALPVARLDRVAQQVHEDFAEELLVHDDP